MTSAAKIKDVWKLASIDSLKRNASIRFVKIREDLLYSLPVAALKWKAKGPEKKENAL